MIAAYDRPRRAALAIHTRDSLNTRPRRAATPIHYLCNIITPENVPRHEAVTLNGGNKKEAGCCCCCYSGLPCSGGGGGGACKVTRGGGVTPDDTVTVRCYGGEGGVFV